jgi:hypothetical protein
VAILKDCRNHKKPPATTHAVRLTVALEAATLSFAIRDMRLAVLVPVKAESGSAAFLFLFLNAPDLTQLMKAGQLHYQT